MQHIPQIIRRKISSERKHNSVIDKAVAKVEEANEFISIVEAAKIFGFSETFWRKAIREKNLKHYKIGGHTVRLKKTDIVSWFESYKVG